MKSPEKNPAPRRRGQLSPATLRMLDNYVLPQLEQAHAAGRRIKYRITRYGIAFKAGAASFSVLRCTLDELPKVKEFLERNRETLNNPARDHLKIIHGESKNPDYTGDDPPSDADTSRRRMRDDLNIAVKQAKASNTLELTKALAVARYEVLARHVDLLNPRLAEGERLRRAERLVTAYKRLRKLKPDFRDTGEQLRAARRIRMADYRERKIPKEARRAAI